MSTSTSNSPPPEPLTKLGRGGAGNFYTKKEFEELVAQNSHQHHLSHPPDLEAQRLKSVYLPSSPISPLSLNQSTATSPTWTKTGRGGAGNYFSPVEHDASPMYAQRATIGAVPDLGSRKTGGVSGRGGAGNWYAVKEEEERRRQQDARKTREEGKVIEERVKVDVESGLKVPDRVARRDGRTDGIW